MNTQNTIRSETVPEFARAALGNALLRDFLENIRDPEKLKLYNELGKAFLERRAAEKGGTV